MSRSHSSLQKLVAESHPGRSKDGKAVMRLAPGLAAGPAPAACRAWAGLAQVGRVPEGLAPLVQSVQCSSNPVQLEAAAKGQQN
mmetsp:Transcript_65893/g.146408  ORF Transcript_65893/g.146408 Transcript_65893/m.146408 type:complete len:84 (-) Transcript_65893:481-732(-)